jgi:3-hydroxyisobutyrate dehydrogenase
MDSLTLNDLPLAFIGTGVMGAPMAGHLLDAGCRLCVYTRTASKAQPLLDRGASWAASPAEAAAGAHVVCTMLGYPDDVEAVYLGSGGLIEACEAGTLLIDFTTSKPALAQRIAEEAHARGLSAIDAPVSGGDVGAREARLSIMVGGEVKAVGAARALLNRVGANVVHQGPAGSGQYTKMCNQIVIASTMMGVSEALHYAQNAGLEPETVLQSIRSGAAGGWTLENLAPRMLKGDFAPGFYIKHFVKDMGIALESARELGLELPGLGQALALYERMLADGHGELGTQALLKHYQEKLR